MLITLEGIVVPIKRRCPQVWSSPGPVCRQGSPGLCDARPPPPGCPAPALGTVLYFVRLSSNENISIIVLLRCNSRTTKFTLFGGKGTDFSWFLSVFPLGALQPQMLSKHLKSERGNKWRKKEIIAILEGGMMRWNKPSKPTFPFWKPHITTPTPTTPGTRAGRLGPVCSFCTPGLSQSFPFWCFVKRWRVGDKYSPLG